MTAPRLKRHKQRGMRKRRLGNRKPMTEEAKIARKKKAEIQREENKKRLEKEKSKKTKSTTKKE